MFKQEEYMLSSKIIAALAVAGALEKAESNLTDLDAKARRHFDGASSRSPARISSSKPRKILSARITW